MLVSRLRTASILLAAALVVALAGAWPFVAVHAVNPPRLAAPHPLWVACAVAFVAVATFGAGPARPLWRFVASAFPFVAWCSFRVLTMGDGAWWRPATADGTVSRAEPLSSLVYAVVHRAFGADAIEWIPPVAGLFAAWAWLCSTDRLLGQRHPTDARLRLLAALLWLASGVPVLFCHRYVEHTQIGVAPLLLGVAHATAWARAEPQRGTRDLLFGGGLLAVAALTHLQYSGMLVAAAIAVALLARRRGASAALRLGWPFAAGVVGVAAAAAAVVWASPFALIHGSIYGGADGRLLVTPAELLAPAHVAMVATALAFAVPMALPFAVGVLLRWRALAAEPPGDLVLVATAAAYLAFVSLFGFDLGWPRDVDLMTSMSVGLALLVAVDLAPRLAGAAPAARALLLVCLAVAIAWAAAAAARLVRPRWHDLSQRNSPLATLLVDGAAGAAQDVPHRVPAALGQTVELTVRGTPGYDYWVLVGAPAPACEGDPYGSVGDIRIGDLREALVGYGTLDARGEAVVRWTVAERPGGGWPGLQALVFPGGAHDRNVATAAFYFEPR